MAALACLALRRLSLFLKLSRVLGRTRRVEAMFARLFGANGLVPCGKWHGVCLTILSFVFDPALPDGLEPEQSNLFAIIVVNTEAVLCDGSVLLAPAVMDVATFRNSEVGGILEVIQPFGIYDPFNRVVR